ncbi:CD63 antigen [Glossina fuscipes]|uniref:Tetraspanin n=1 Tax=Glossina fuscipes TaxID=7396 RepID=A0A9C5Z674_9MUSC|nr:CD63 antigen [Glossina fuscipes]XP_037894712.1 CD63 antigen [Glossina fuscipes]KAI9578768.1 hypothetical protein GQX74_009342 [Glossina fuscipes]
MASGLGCIKCITFFCNLLFALTGLLILFVGAMVQLNYSHYSNFVSEQIWTAPIILIIIGSIVAFICFLGCCGALKENGCMILSFAILAFAIFICEIGLGIAGYMKHAGLRRIMEAQFNVTMRDYNERDDYRDAWSLLQSELECCGTYGPSDWEAVYHNTTLHASCCPIIVLNEADKCTTAHASPDGCLNKLIHILDSNALVLAGVVLGVATIQLLTILFACCLCRSFCGSYQTV